MHVYGKVFLNSLEFLALVSLIISATLGFRMESVVAPALPSLGHPQIYMIIMLIISFSQ